MRLRLLFTLALSACVPSDVLAAAQTAPDAGAPVQAPVTLSPIDPPSVATPTAVDPAFAAWRDAFTERAVARGLDRGFVQQELADVTPNARIVALDGKQPEFSKPIGDYIRSAVTSGRIAEAQTRRQTLYRLPGIEQRYGVPAEILLGIWAQESGFGKIQGDFDVVTAFATLAYDGRRRDWAETQLIDALLILKDKGIPRSKLKGSWAGAMGQTQFIPEAYLKLGQDADGDGKADIWNSSDDALASAANLLSQGGWKAGESWAVEVTLPYGFDYSMAETQKLTPDQWAARGVKRADAAVWSPADAAETATLILPAGANGPAFLAFPNHYVIRKYNNSTAYALAVGLLADGVRGAPQLARAWPYETPLSRDQRYAAQEALTKLGYPVGTVDGVIGTGTRTALRAWQQSAGVIADGYLDQPTLNRLLLAAGMPASGAPTVTLASPTPGTTPAAGTPAQPQPYMPSQPQPYVGPGSSPPGKR